MPFFTQLKQLLFLLLCLIIAGLTVVAILLWLKVDRTEQLLTNSAQETVSPENSENLATSTDFISVIDQDWLEASVSALAARLEQVEKNQKTIQNQIATSASAQSKSTIPTFTKETLFLGSASTNNREWSETGLEIGINSAHYPQGVTVKLESSLSIIGGEAWVRLKNKSTGAIISISEISHNTNVATWKLSPSFALHTGGYTYVLEARSSSGETANISGARLIIER